MTDPMKPDAAEQAAEHIDRDKAIIFGELAEPRIDAIARIIREKYALARKPKEAVAEQTRAAELRAQQTAERIVKTRWYKREGSPRNPIPELTAIIREAYAEWEQDFARLIINETGRLGALNRVIELDQQVVELAKMIDEYLPGHFGESPSKTIPALEQQARELNNVITLERSWKEKAQQQVVELAKMIDEYLPGHFGESPSKTIPALEQQARELAELLQYVADNRGKCFIPNPDSWWDNRVNAVLANFRKGTP